MAVHLHLTLIMLPHLSPCFTFLTFHFLYPSISLSPSLHLISLFLPHRPVPNYLTATVETVLSIHREGRPGDVLAFLTGQEEVEKTVAELR